MTLRPLLALTMVSALALTEPVFAQANEPSQDGSLTHSAMKATTFKVGSTVVNLVLLSSAADGIVGGAALTTFMAVSSWSIYTANDYLWDRYAPPPPRQAGEQAFDASDNAMRNTLKFLTFKPVVASVKLISLYAYTGSLATTAVFGGAAIITNSVVFYANNMLWDFYSWSAAPPPMTVTAQR